MQAYQHPPSIPTQFARPVPAQTAPAPANYAPANGPFGAQPYQAPIVGGPSTLPPASTIPAALRVPPPPAAGVPFIPATVLAIPLAIGMGETGNPITSTANEKELIRRANKGEFPDPLAAQRPKKPGTPDAPPSNPPVGPNPTRTKRPPVRGIVGTFRLQTYNKGVAQWSWDYPNRRSGDVPTVTTVGPGWIRGNFPSDGFLAGEWGDINTQNESPSFQYTFIPDVPPVGSGNPPNPGSNPNAPPYQQRPPLAPNPNPNLPQQPPNPTNPNQSQTARPNPTQPNPTNPNPTQPTQPTQPNPTQPNPTNPNPTNPAPVNPNPTQPTNPNPVNPNPTQPNPTQPNPTNPTNPTQTNPTLPNPVNPGPIVPRVPGPIVPSNPGPIVPRVPVPIGPSNPKPDPCLDPCIANAVDKLETVTIRVKQFVDCERKVFGVPFPFDPVDVNVPKSLANAFALMLNNQADVLYAAECKDCDDNVAAVPDWWGTRLGAERPQLMIQFARKFNDGKWDKPKYAMSIPYWKLNKEQTRNFSFPVYQKGSIQSALILPDNSKLIVNAIDIPEGERVLAGIASGMDSAMVAAAEQTYSLRRGRELREIVVYPRIARFFSTGQRNLNPDWSVKFL